MILLVRRAWPVGLLLLGLSSCKCAKAPSLGPLEDPRPASLGETGLLVEQPAEANGVTSKWVTVTGWVDRSRYAFVAVVGAPSTAFYAAGGHVGIPSVPVSLRDDGRFIAPRVPLEMGTTDVVVMALTSEGKVGPTVTRRLQVERLWTPATVTNSPSEGGRAPLTVSFEPHTDLAVLNWQWDYDGDGRFDEEGLTGKYTYREPGTYVVQARSLVDGQWVMAVTAVQVYADAEVTHQSSAVTNPRGIVIVPRPFSVLETFHPSDALATEDTAFTKEVLVLDGDVIKVFDAQLNLVKTLEAGFRSPGGAAADPFGRLYVADTGNHRIVRLLESGALDTAFADAGSLTTTVHGAPFVSPGSLHLRRGYARDGGISVELEFATANEMISCDGDQRGDGDPVECHAGSQRVSKLIRTKSFVGSSGDWWLIDGTVYTHIDLSRPRSSGGDVIDAAPDLMDHNPWWVVLRPNGRLEERFSTDSNLRVSRLGFPATTIAVDGSADHILRDRLGDDFSYRVSGPHVIYVAGPGRIERRVLPLMAEGLW